MGSVDSAEVILENRRLSARFSEQTGRLLHLSVPGGKNLLKHCHCRFNHAGTSWVEGLAGEGEQSLQAADVRVANDAVESVLGTPFLEITRGFALARDAALLQVTCTVRATAPGVSLLHNAFPSVGLRDSFINVMEDEEDLYFDGEELGGGWELPCWRVFFNEGHRDGVIVATRSKVEMSRLQINDHGFDIRPHVMTAYDTRTGIVHSAMEFAGRGEHSAAFEIAPWQESRHDAIVEAAGLDEPVDVGSAPPAGSPPGDLRGIVVDALDFAGRAASDTFARDKWMIAELPCCRGGRALLAGPSVSPPPLTASPNLEGVHRIFVGIGNGDGIVAQLSGDEMPTFRMRQATISRTPFHLCLSGEQQSREVELHTAEMSGRTLTLSRFPDSLARTVIDYVRFEKLDQAGAAAWREQERRSPCIRLSGFNDIADIARFTSVRDPDPAAYEANLWEHANCGIRKVFWRIDGQCSDFPCTTNTMRYPSARVHGVFYPHSKAYGRVLKKVDILDLAVKAARRYGLKLYGWMRFNNYTGNVQNDFFRNHPEYHDQSPSGRNLGKLCLAAEAVRQHKIDILVEAASYGLDGLCLGFLRHPPILLYAPVLVEGYEKQYGEPPPRDRDDPDPYCREVLPCMDEAHVRWYAYRAKFMTQFGRDLRAALRQKGMGHVRIAIWVRPNHCLFDGIDMQTWLAEGLCDEVVADQYVSADVCEVRPEWKRMVQQRAELIRGISSLSDIGEARQDVRKILAEDYDGLCVYESDYAVLQSDFIELSRSLRTR